jgi:IS5 family transposase
LNATPSRRGEWHFLAEMERVVRWSALCELIATFYSKPGNGRPRIGVERMLRIYFLRHWLNPSHLAVEEALYGSQAMRGFVGLDLCREPVPDEITVCRSRHLLEARDLGRRLFDEVQRHLAVKGLKVAIGTVVHVTIINAPSSTKNAKKARDPEMHQTKKGNQWYFGMKAHFGVDSHSSLIHAAAATPAKVADSAVLPEVLQGNETRVWGDQAYRGQRAVIRRHAPRAQDLVNRRDRHHGIVDAVGRAKTASNRKSRPRWSIRSGSSSGCSACQSALSRAQKERSPPHHHLRAHQSIYRAPASTALPKGVACPRFSNTAQSTKDGQYGAAHPSLLLTEESLCL